MKHFSPQTGKTNFTLIPKATRVQQMEHNLPLETDEDIAVQPISLHALGRNWTIHRPASLEDLWEQMTAAPVVTPVASIDSADFTKDINHRNYHNRGQHNLARSLHQAFEEDDRIPYWTEIWPAGVALGEWLGEQSKKIKNRTCLDLGCGLGFTALVGAWLGAKVLAMDYEHQALYYAALNERLLKENEFQTTGQISNHNLAENSDECSLKGTNKINLSDKNPAGHPTTTHPSITCQPNAHAPAGESPVWLTADWRHPCFKRGSIEVIWAGDIMYEHRFINPVANFLEHALAKNGVVWIAEPGRNIYPEFAKTMQNRGWQVYIAGRRQARLPESRAPLVNVQIWQLQRKSL